MTKITDDIAREKAAPRAWHTCSVSSAFEELRSGPSGLSSAEAQPRML